MANAITVRQIYTCAAEIITLSDNRWQMKNFFAERAPPLRGAGQVEWLAGGWL